MNTLPQIIETNAELIDGKQVQKQIYADGSYGILEDDTVKRYLPNKTIQTYKLSLETNEFILVTEKELDGTLRQWHDNGQLEYEVIPDKTTTRYDKTGKIIYHATKGIEDTKKYLRAKKHRAILRKIIAQKIEERDSRFLDLEKKTYYSVIKNKMLIRFKLALEIIQSNHSENKKTH